MSDESKQHWLSRNRPPRVQITYDVETLGAIRKQELPLVVGILADLAGTNKQPEMKLRKFVEIDVENFDAVMAKIRPRLELKRVKNHIQSGDAKAEVVQVDLDFRELKDFRSESIVKHYEPLRQLFEARQRLNDLVAKLDGNDDLNTLLNQIATNTEEQTKVKGDIQTQRKQLTDGGANG